MPNQLAIETLSIADWVKGLSAIRERDFTLENVQDYIVRHAVRPETLDNYIFFSKGNYTRNLIFKNELFRVHDNLLGSRAAQPHPQSSRPELLDVRADRPPKNPEFPRRR